MVQLNVVGIQLLVAAHVYLECLALRETLVAVLTLERLLARMCHQVTEEDFLLRERSMTDVAAEWFLTCKQYQKHSIREVQSVSSSILTNIVIADLQDPHQPVCVRSCLTRADLVGNHFSQAWQVNPRCAE